MKNRVYKLIKSKKHLMNFLYLNKNLISFLLKNKKHKYRPMIIKKEKKVKKSIQAKPTFTQIIMKVKQHH